MEHSHRPTQSWAKPNKQHKGPASKGQLRAREKGRVAGSRISLKNFATLSKPDRRNAAKMVQRDKRDSMLATRRLFSQVPKIIALVPLCPDTRSSDWLESNFPGSTEGLSELRLSSPVKQHKQTFQFIANQRNLLEVLDSVKVADYVGFLVSAKEPVDHFGDLCISSIQAQGVPSVIGLVQHLDTIALKKQSGVQKSLQAFLEDRFAGEIKQFTSVKHATSLTRYLSTQTPKQVVWRGRHSYLLGERVERNPESGTLAVSGYLRGRNLSANSLIHLQNFGNFQIEKVSSPASADQYIQIVVSHSENDDRLARSSMNLDDAAILPDDRIRSLVSENEPDIMEGEQTWPTDQEIAEADQRVAEQRAAAAKRRLVKVPKGTSAYQAAWITNSDDEDHEEDDDDDGDRVMIDGPEADDHSDDAGSEHEYVDLESDAVSVAPTTAAGTEFELDEDEEARQYQEYLAEKKKLKESNEHAEFPDEIDTPVDVSARVRFQKYRGLKSFRSSPWDCYENLPVDYSRIFQFQNFSRTRSSVFKDLENNLEPETDARVVSAGSFVTIHIASFPADQALVSGPLILFNLLNHEQKMSVVNFSVTRPSVSSIAESLAFAAAKDDDMASILESTNAKSVDNGGISIQMREFSLPAEYVVRSKDPLLMCVGFRRLLVRPVYSTNTVGGSNNVHKFERFLLPGKASVGSVYAPIQFAPAPVTLFKLSSSGLPLLIGSGSVLTNDPSRILAKRIVLTGHPYKIHKRSATIRYMFHGAEDIRFFKPVELTTKYGRKGHIKCPIGTHGYMKCLFDTQVTQQDTICMNLYKRVYPKWDTQLFDTADSETRRMFEVEEGKDGMSLCR